MTTPFPVGLRIVKLAGLLEGESKSPFEPQYSLVMQLSSEAVALLWQNGVSELLVWPDVVDEMPSQYVDFQGDLVGRSITNAFVRLGRDGLGRSANGPQLFLVLDGTWIMSVVATQHGTKLHVEPLLTSPLFRAEDEFATLDGRRVSLDDMVGF